MHAKSKSLCVRVPKKMGEVVRKKLMQEGILNKSLKIKVEGEYILIPITRKVNDYVIEEHEFEILKKKKKFSLKEMLGYSPAYEIIGDIAIIDRHESDKSDIHNLANLLLSEKRIKTVVLAETPVNGEFRVRKLSFIAGVKKTETLHKENKCLFLLDLAKVYFSPRLATERMRIANQIKDWDKVIDMFAGVGPFSILIAKRYPHAKVIAIDKNPYAIYYLKKNIKLNKVENLEVRQGDVREVIKGISDADHIIMNLPHNAFDFLKECIHAVKNGGVIHLYAIAHKEKINTVLKKIQEVAHKMNVEIIPLNIRVVRPYAPYQYNICVDFRVKK